MATSDFLKALSTGIDPLTGAKVPEDSLLNRPDVKAVLAHAAVLLDSSAKPTKKLTDDEKAIREKEKRAKNIAQGLPERSGFAWTDPEVQWLQSKFSAGVQVAGSALVKKLQRKESAILMKSVALQLIPSWGQVPKFVVVSEDTAEYVQKQIQVELEAQTST